MGKASQNFPKPREMATFSLQHSPILTDSSHKLSFPPHQILSHNHENLSQKTKKTGNNYSSTAPSNPAGLQHQSFLKHQKLAHNHQTLIFAWKFPFSSHNHQLPPKKPQKRKTAKKQTRNQLETFTPKKSPPKQKPQRTKTAKKPKPESTPQIHKTEKPELAIRQ